MLEKKGGLSKENNLSKSVNKRETRGSNVDVEHDGDDVVALFEGLFNDPLFCGDRY